MDRRLFSVMLVVAACYGHQAGSTAAQTALEETNTAAQASGSTSPKTTRSTPVKDGRENDDSDTRPRDDRARYVSFPAAGVKLVRPDGFDNAENFHGFQQAGSQSSIMVMMIPGPFSETTRGFTPERLATRGITLRTKESVEIDGNSGLLLGVTQKAYGTEFEKWILAFGNEGKTRMVTATFPKSDDATLSEQLKVIVLGTKVDDAPPPVPGADLGFSIAGSEKLKLTTGIGKVLMYTKDGTIPAKSPDDPLFIAAPSLSKPPIDNERQFAVDRLFQTAHTKISSLLSNTEITIDGLDGYEIVAVGENADSGTPLRVYQVMLFDEGSYILMQGLVTADVADEYLPEFKAMARSLTRTRK